MIRLPSELRTLIINYLPIKYIYTLWRDHPEVANWNLITPKLQITTTVPIGVPGFIEAKIEPYLSIATAGGVIYGKNIECIICHTRKVEFQRNWLENALLYDKNTITHGECTPTLLLFTSIVIAGLCAIAIRDDDYVAYIKSRPKELSEFIVNKVVDYLSNNKLLR